MKLKKILSFLSILLVSIALVTTSCNDDSKDPVPEGGEEETEDGRVPEKPNFEQKQTMDVSGFVADENDEPLKNVKVQAGDSIVLTNEHGHFVLQNVNLVENHSFVVAEKDGYFRGIRTWMGKKDGKYEVRIKLLPKTVSGSFVAKTGGEIVSPEGVKLTFPSEAIVTADGTVYTGKVDVAVQWLDAVADDFPTTMPGDLSAIDASGNTVTLISYGMAAVELTGESNELLQIAEGKTVNSIVPIAPELQSTAGDTIPLWYFDETKGMWVEEGVAKKEGNTYVGELGHFSWWNWDYLFPFVNVTARIVDQSGDPLPYQSFKYTVGSDVGGYPVSDINGMINFRMPINTSGELYLAYGNRFCEKLMSEFSVGEVDIDLGDLVIPIGIFLSVKEDYTVVEGDVRADCDPSLLFHGNVYLTVGTASYSSPLFNGRYYFKILLCEDDPNVAQLSCYTYFTPNGKRMYYNDSRDVTIQKKGNTTVPFIKECEEVTLSGTATNCYGSPYQGGSVEFVADKTKEVYKSDIVDGKYQLKIKALNDISGRLIVYNRKSGIVDILYPMMEVNGNKNVTYNHQIEEPILLTGKVFGCNNEPLLNGVVVIESSRFSAVVPVRNGVYTYESPIQTCDNVPAKIIARDYDNSTEVSQDVVLVPLNNNIPDMTVCKAPVVEFSYFKYEYDGLKVSMNSEDVYGVCWLLEFVEVGGYSYQGGNNRTMSIQWNIYKDPSVGVFDIESGNLYVTDADGYYEHLPIEGKVTVTETFFDNESKKFKIRGTFEGEIQDEEGLNKRPIKGEFMFNGRSNPPM